MLRPVADLEWPEALGSLRSSFTGQANVYRTMAHHPALLAAWQDLRRHVVLENALGPERLEVVILRIGTRLSAKYERAHHIVRARKLGFSDLRIAQIGGTPYNMEAQDALLARAVDALTENASLPEALQAELLREIGKEGLLDLVATVGFYMTLAFIVKSFATPVDFDIERALVERPFTGLEDG